MTLQLLEKTLRLVQERLLEQMLFILNAILRGIKNGGQVVALSLRTMWILAQVAPLIKAYQAIPLLAKGLKLIAKCISDTMLKLAKIASLLLKWVSVVTLLWKMKSSFMVKSVLLKILELVKKPLF